MTIDPNRNYRRWRAAEAEGRDDEADAEFGALFGAVVPPPGVGADFAARTMQAVSAAAAQELRRARRVRRLTVAAGIGGSAAAAYFGAGLIATLVSAAFTRGFDLLIGMVVRIAGAVQTGADLWSVLASVGRAAAALATDPTVTMMLFALQGIAVVALLALQRLLGTDEESLK
jgi:hypothetical protein